MTTTVATPLPSSSPHRIRRNLIATLAGGVLIASTVLVVNRIVDNDSATVPVQAPNAPSVGAAAASPPPVNPAAAPPQGRLVINEPMAAACADGLAEACHDAFEWVPAPAVSSHVTAEDICASGVAWACIHTPQPTEIPSGVTAADVCTGEFASACVFTTLS